MAVEVRIDGPIAWLTLNRPDVLNALDGKTIQALGQFAGKVSADESIRVAVITGAGPVFCAGADLTEFVESLSDGAQNPGEADFLDGVFITFSALRNVQKPMIAAVNGPTMAGGLELVLCCDLVVAAESATFGDAHANYGIFPGAGGAAVLPRRVPANVAKYLLLTGRSLTAREMYDHGFVNLLVADADLEKQALDLAETVAAKSPLVLAQMKRVANDAPTKPIADSLIDEFLCLRNHTRSQDLREGLAAFKEKRRPAFTGR